MHNSIGSVYLDAPRDQPDGRPSHDHRPRSVLAGFLALIGMLALTVAGVVSGIAVFARSSEPAKAAIDAAFDEPIARTEIEAELTEAIATELLDPALVDAAESFGVDVDAEVAALAQAMLDDDAFRAGLHQVVDDVHRRMFVESSAAPLDVSALTEALLAATEANAPGISGVVPTDGQVVRVDGSTIPDLTGVNDVLDRAQLVALALGVALALAWLVHPHRHLVVAWTGRWLLAMGILLALAAVGLPYLAGNLTGWITVEAAVRSWSLRLLAPAVIAGIVGMGFTSLAAVTRRREERRHVDHGAAMALGVMEPMAFPVDRDPSLELARRGLPDASRQLTNI